MDGDEKLVQYSRDPNESALFTYEQLRLLGKGGCAQVFLAKNKNTGKYVIFLILKLLHHCVIYLFQMG